MKKTWLFILACWFFQPFSATAETRGAPCAQGVRVGERLAVKPSAQQDQEIVENSPLEILAMGETPVEDALDNKLVRIGDAVVGMDIRKKELILWGWKDLKIRWKCKGPDKSSQFVSSLDKKSIFILAKDQIVMVDAANGKEVRKWDIECKGTAIYPASPDLLLIGDANTVAVFSISRNTVIDRIPFCSGDFLIRLSDDRVLARGGILTVGRNASGNAVIGCVRYVKHDFYDVHGMGCDGFVAAHGKLYRVGNSYVTFESPIMTLSEGGSTVCAGSPKSSLVVQAAELDTWKIYDSKAVALLREIKTTGNKNYGIYRPRCMVLDETGKEAVVCAAPGSANDCGSFRIFRVKLPLDPHTGVPVDPAAAASSSKTAARKTAGQTGECLVKPVVPLPPGPALSLKDEWGIVAKADFRGMASDMVLSPDRKHLYALELSGCKVFKFRTDTLAKVGEFQVADDAVAMAMDHDGAKVYVVSRRTIGEKTPIGTFQWTPKGRIEAFDARSLVREKEILISQDPTGIAMAGTDAAVVSFPGGTLLVDVGTGKGALACAHAGGEGNLLVSPDRTGVYGVSSGTRCCLTSFVADPKTPCHLLGDDPKAAARTVPTLKSRASGIDANIGRKLFLSPDGAWLIGAHGAVLKLPAKNNESSDGLAIEPADAIDPWRSAAGAPGCGTFFTSSAKGFIRAYSAGEKVELVRTSKLKEGRCASLLLDPDRGVLFALLVPHGALRYPDEVVEGPPCSPPAEIIALSVAAPKGAKP